jgi:hypothetical protein
VTKFRQTIAIPLAAGVALVGASPIALQPFAWGENQPLFLLPILLVPLAVLWWGLRSGVDADAERLTVRALAGSRTYRWPDVAGFRVDGRKVLLETSSGTEVPLPAVRPADVPKLIAASGGSLSRA